MEDLRNIVRAILEEGNTVVDWDIRNDYVSVKHINTCDEYFFQGEDYNNLYDEYLNSDIHYELYFDEYLYLVSQNW